MPVPTRLKNRKDEIRPSPKVNVAPRLLRCTFTGCRCRKKLVKLVEALPRSEEGSGLRKIECQIFSGSSIIAFQGLVLVWLRILANSSPVQSRCPCPLRSRHLARG